MGTTIDGFRLSFLSGPDVRRGQLVVGWSIRIIGEPVQLGCARLGFQMLYVKNFSQMHH
jgi:hypothetical protein